MLQLLPVDILDQIRTHLSQNDTLTLRQVCRNMVTPIKLGSRPFDHAVMKLKRAVDCYLDDANYWPTENEKSVENAWSAPSLSYRYWPVGWWRIVRPCMWMVLAITQTRISERTSHYKANPKSINVSVSSDQRWATLKWTNISGKWE